ncbi:MAG: YhgE/Pip domain-containing protein [Rhizobacter sp.]
MALVRSSLAVARLEATLFRRYPKLLLSVLGIVVIPAIYAYIYLGSVWDPAGHTINLPAAIVNLDKGARVGDQQVNLGTDLVETLKAKNVFGYYDAHDEQAARLDVRKGRSLFALIIPEDFSESAMAAQLAGAGKLVVYASEGNNYTGAGFAKRFAGELGHQMNETLNEKRWASVLGTTASSADNLQRLRDGVAQLNEGAGKLHNGLATARQGTAQLTHATAGLSGGVGTLTDGVKQLHAGAQTLNARSPKPDELRRLNEGAGQLVAGHNELQKGLLALEEGSLRLVQGAGTLREESEDIPFFGAKLSEGAGELAKGGDQLHDGLRAAHLGEIKLTEGASALAKNLGQLTDGFGTYAGGVSTLTSRFPADARLDELSAGGRAVNDASARLNAGLAELQAGSIQLVSGLQALASALPATDPKLEGTAEGLAHSIEPDVQIDAPVASNGMGLAPNFIPVSLWMGAVMTAFIFHLRRLPEEAAGHSRMALLLGKLGVLGSINIAQAICVLLMTWLMLGLQPVHAAGLALTMVISSLTFMLLILLLVRAFGDVGKAVTLVLLVLQLSAAGGVLPVELTNDFFRAISPGLPFTWSIQAVRASAFGAFGGDWGQALGVLAAFAVGAFALSLLIKWRFVGRDEHRPAMDI